MTVSNERKANCGAKMIDGHLCIFCLCDIEAGDELLYYYGETDDNMYWRLGQEPKCYFTPVCKPYGSIEVVGTSAKFDMNSTLCYIGSDKSCDIICKTAREKHYKIEINMSGQAFLVDLITSKQKLQAHELQHLEEFHAGDRSFRWLYANNNKFEGKSGCTGCSGQDSEDANLDMAEKDVMHTDTVIDHSPILSAPHNFDFNNVGISSENVAEPQIMDLSEHNTDAMQNLSDICNVHGKKLVSQTSTEKDDSQRLLVPANLNHLSNVGISSENVTKPQIMDLSEHNTDAMQNLSNICNVHSKKSVSETSTEKDDSQTLLVPANLDHLSYVGISSENVTEPQIMDLSEHNTDAMQNLSNICNVHGKKLVSQTSTEKDDSQRLLVPANLDHLSNVGISSENVTEPKIMDLSEHNTDAMQNLSDICNVHGKKLVPQTGIEKDDSLRLWVPANLDHLSKVGISSENVTEPQIMDSSEHDTDAMQNYMSDYCNGHGKKLVSQTCTEKDDSPILSVPANLDHLSNVRISSDNVIKPQMMNLSEHNTDVLLEDMEDVSSTKSYESSYDDSLHDPDWSEQSYVSDSDTSEVLDTFPELTVKRKLARKPSHLMKTEVQVDTVTSSDRVAMGCRNKISDNSNVDVQRRSNSLKERKWDKLHYCVYCDDDYGSTNIRKHYLTAKHKKETEVQRILSYPKGSKQRKLAWDQLRQAGDFKHNTNVLRKGEGVLITVTRNSEPTSSEDYLPCEFCLGFFLKSGLWRHQQKCSFNKDHKKGRRVQSEARLLLPASVEVSNGLKQNVLRRMSGDEVSITVRNDPLILKIGEKMFLKHGRHIHLHTYIGQKMRELGRFLIRARMLDNRIMHLSDIIDATKFPVVVDVTKSLCQYDNITNKYRNPSLALKLGHLLKKAARILKTSSMISCDSTQKEKASEFLSVCEEEWTDEISFGAHSTLAENKMNKKMLPLSEDILKLQKFIQTSSDLSAKALEEGFSKSQWELLNKLTLAK